ncbi:uncharacterized protein [Blastocystis hominis]|uniref:UTP23 sensor motif region domain-containing protein n=1 Tax=Blastocystis hominis TaxID=12968 RepID=D8M9Y8_BLAHO|nr:uncharacterized protein [Blastocystis hominis]CBK24877.2 unnamed protein product [Blastocystis hominis]|eukprot:XP_012898925.1 uncharacterized protein [Blastocystis hominis]
MQYYEINYGFRSPYTVILEESFIRYGLDLNLPNSIEDLIRSAVQDPEAELVITDCIRKRFLEFKDKNQRDFEYTKRLRCIKCNHKEPLSSIKCIMDLAKNMKKSKEKYVICTQKDLYKMDLRRIPGVPLIYFNRSVLTLDTPSKNSHHAVDNAVMSKLGITKEEKKEIGIRKEKREERSYNPLIDIHHHKKNPNPLSVKKKKNVPPPPREAGEKKKVRRSKKSKQEKSAETKEE